ncbi:hypothetical protein [Ktedonobacter sp. SOSP1-52]|nr:hypothetical protein [Ktedonobacter sp. SOSP1-52]
MSQVASASGRSGREGESQATRVQGLLWGQVDAAAIGQLHV